MIVGLHRFEIQRHRYAGAAQRPTFHEWKRDLPRPAKPIPAPVTPAI